MVSPFQGIIIAFVHSSSPGGSEFLQGRGHMSFQPPTYGTGSGLGDACWVNKCTYKFCFKILFLLTCKHIQLEKQHFSYINLISYNGTQLLW